MYKYIRDIISIPNTRLGKLWMFAVIMLMSANISVLADTPLTIGTAYPDYKTKTYTITSCGSNGTHHQMYAASATATTLSSTNVTSTVNKGDLYRFAFVQDPDNPTNYYLYNVGAKRFVTSVNGDRNAYLYDGNNGTLTPVYVYNPNSENHNHVAASDTSTYCRAITFGDDHLEFEQRGSGGSTNNTWHLLGIGLQNPTVQIQDWTYLGSGSGAYSISIADAGTELTAEDLADAQSRLKAYQKKTLSELNLKANTVYTLKTKSGATLYANGTSLAAATDASNISDANKQFVFEKDTIEGGTNVYLYSVGQKRYYNLSRRSFMDGSEVSNPVAAPVYFYSTGIENTFAISLSDSWDSGQYNFNVSNNTVNINNTKTRSDDNQFVATEVTETTTYSETEAVRRLRVKSSNHSRTTFGQEGIKINSQKYVFESVRGGMQANSAGNALERVLPGNINVNEPKQQFVLITKTEGDSTLVYLYNVGAKKFAHQAGTNRSAMTLVASSEASPIYVYPTNSYDYNLALSFISSSYSPGINISDNSLVVTSNGSFDDGNRWRVYKPTTGEQIISDADLRTARAALNGWLTGPFHFRGASGNAFKSNGMQDVAEVNYYYYVDTRRRQYGTKTHPERAAIDLQLSFKRFLNRSFIGPNYQVLYTSTKQNYSGSPDHDNASIGNNYEPKGYIRWYNYHTDSKMSDSKLIPWNSADNNFESNGSGTNVLSGNYYDQNGKPLGLIAYKLSNNPNAATIGTAYIIPEAANDSTWAGDTIACDVSFYTDLGVPMKADGTIDGNYSNYNQTNYSSFQHEPTLSTRYIFHILPAQKIANELRSVLITPVRGHTTTYGDRGVFSFGALDKNSTMALRIPVPDVPYMYFWPLNEPNKHHVYHKEGDNHGISKEYIPISGQPEEAAWIQYRVYSADSTMWRVVTTDRQKMVNISLNTLNGNDWKDLEGNQVEASKMPKLDIGSTCFLVGYALNENQDKACPFFNSRLDISSNSPLSADSLRTGHYPNRQNEYMQTHYGSPIAQFTFDSENTQQTLTQPKGLLTDYSTVPFDFSKRDYSFLYIRDLLGLKNDSTPQYPHGCFRDVGYSDYGVLLHGDYVITKSMDLGGTAYDMLHEREPSQYGYFLYTDASDESRSLGSQDFQGSLCSGSQIIVSAWIRNGSGGRHQGNQTWNNVNAAPELRFTLLGVTKDKDNNDISTHEFASLSTGDFATNIKGFVSSNDLDMNTKDWFQVFGTITLPANSGIENYSDFRIEIDNFCNTADGADYAIDDIFVYQSNSKVEVIQDPALCNDTHEARGDVKIKIRGNYSTARQLTGAATGDKTVYYRFCMPNSSTTGTPITGTDFYGKGMNEYGIAKVPENEDDNAELTDDEGEGPKFETDASGITEVILINKSFNLSPDSTYYVSMALDDGGKPGSWGLPSSLCSFYSDYFKLVRQDIFYNGTTTTAKQITIPCGVTESANYSGIKASITAPSHMGTGSVTLTNVPFHWFIGSIKDYKSIADASGKNTLEDAVNAYATKYPGQKFDENKSTETTEGGYSDAYRDLIKANIYSESNPNGRLVMSATDSLSTIPLKLGRDTIVAVVAEDTVTVNNIKYTLCPDPMQLYLQVSQDGPGLTFGMPNVIYPSSESVRNIRIGLPQIKKMYAKNGTLTIPVSEVTYEGTAHNDEELKFLGYKDDDTACDSVYISYTNDPSINLTNVAQTYIGQLTSSNLAGGAANLQMRIVNYNMLHEGYEYTLMFKYKSTNYPKDAPAGQVQCPGETYIRLRIVPEYVTWAPTVDNGLNSNWNNDGNWTRSTAADLYRADYKDYRHATYQFTLYDASGKPVSGKIGMWNQDVDTSLPDSTQQPASYVPMYFTKVIIPTMESQRYPMLGYIAHQASNDLVQSLVNYKQHDATANIRYDMMASPANEDSTSYACVNFDGNVCEQIHFKTGGQLRNEQYLNYVKAWTELALPMNVWGTFTTPMHHSIAADMYVPKVSGMQLTPLFQDIHFTDRDEVDGEGKPYKGTGEMYGMYGKAGDTMYNRARMPVYQKLWGEDPSMHDPNAPRSNYSAYDNPYQMLIFPEPKDDPDVDMHQGVNANNYNVWSHTFNFLANEDAYAHQWEHSVNGIYDDAYGVAGRIGDEFTIPSKDINPRSYAIMRLPKADTEFTYYKTNEDGSVEPDVETVHVDKLRDKNYRLGVDYAATENDLGEVDLTTAALQPQATLAFVKDEYDAEGYPLYIKNSVGNIVFSDSIGIERQADGSIAASDTTSTANGLIYDLVGNPYTSAISVREFIHGNQDIFRKVNRNGQWVYRIWSLIGNDLYEYNDSNVNTIIAPGQSIFIMIQRPGIDVVRFTTRMQADPNIREGSLAKVALAPAPAKIYRIDDKSDLTNIIEHGVDTKVYVWSPQAGTIAVSGETIRRVEIYTVNGQMTDSRDMSGSEKQFSVAPGIYIVRATLKDGTQESHKVAVK